MSLYNLCDSITRQYGLQEPNLALSPPSICSNFTISVSYIVYFGKQKKAVYIYVCAIDLGTRLVRVRNNGSETEARYTVNALN